MINVYGSEKKIYIDLFIDGMVLLKHNSFIHSFIHSFIFFKSLREFDDHSSTVIVVFFTYTYTYTLLIEMSSNAARTHLTDAHQMHVIHPNSGSDYTSHYILSLLVDLPRSFVLHAHTQAFIYIYIYEYLWLLQWVDEISCRHHAKDIYRSSVK